MFKIFCVICESRHTKHIQADLPYGIDKDMIIIAKYPFLARIDGNMQEVSTNTCLYYPAGTPIYCESIGSFYSDAMLQFYADEAFMKILNLPPAKPFILDNTTHIFNMIHVIAGENILDNPEHYNIIDYLMRALLMKISVSAGVTEYIPYYDWLLKIRQNIFQHPEAEWNIKELSGEMHVSPSYLYRLYKRAFNITITQDIIAGRINMAEQLLAFSKMTVTDIALNTGYNNYEHFCRQFKNRTGVTPSQYREKQEGSLFEQ